MRVHLSRFLCTEVHQNLVRMEREAREAAAAGADLVVFPESFLHGYTRRLDSARARERFEALSAEAPGTRFVFGSFTEEGRNRMTVWRGGREVARYDKVHLFRPNGEDRIWTPGDRYAALEAGEWRIGLVNCNDLRFPEQTRTLRLEAGVDLLVVVAWWPWRRDHVWRTLLQARAIENGIFVAGCCLAASEHPEEPFSGAGNHVFDPLGEPVPTPDDHTYVLDRTTLGRVTVDTRGLFVPVSGVERFVD